MINSSLIPNPAIVSQTDEKAGFEVCRFEDMQITIPTEQMIDVIKHALDQDDHKVN